MPLRQIAAVLAYRILPFLACALFSRAMSVVQRVAVVLSFACALFVARRFSTDLRDVLVRGPLALIYFAAVSLAVYEIERRNRRLPAPLLLAGCAIAYMLAPALLLPSPFIGATIGIGWEVMLSAFSFYIDSRAAPTLPTRRDCLFFIIVNPCLVFADSGRPIAEPVPWRGVGRVAFGLGTWVLQCFIAAVALTIPAPRSGSYAAFVMVGVTAATHLYLAHSGLASVQIGLTRIVGHQVPERYNYPFLSRSPEDFWRRWNAYLGTWVKRYVFFPIALGVRRAGPRLPKWVGSTAGVLVAFCCVGALHDDCIWVTHVGTRQSFRPTAHMTLAFVGFGLVLSAWHALTNEPNRTCAADRKGVALPKVGRVLSVAAFLNVAWGMVWVLVRFKAL